MGQATQKGLAPEVPFGSRRAARPVLGASLLTPETAGSLWDGTGCAEQGRQQHPSPSALAQLLSAVGFPSTTGYVKALPAEQGLGASSLRPLTWA